MDYYIAITPSSWPRPWEVFRNPINLVIIAVITYTIVKTLSEASKIYAGLIILETSVKFSMQFLSSQRLGEACRVIVQLSGSVIVGMRSEGAGGSKVRPGVRLMSSHHAITPPQHTQTGASRFNSSSTWLSQPILHASFEEGHLKFSETSDKDDVDLSNPNSHCYHQQIHSRQNKARRKSKSWAKPSD